MTGRFRAGGRRLTRTFPSALAGSAWRAAAGCGLVLLAVSLFSQPAMGFQDDAADAKTPPADVKAQPAPPAAADAEAAPGAASPSTERQSFLMWMVRASGVFGFVLLLLSIIMVALIALNVLQVRRDVLMPPEFIDDFESRVTSKDFQGAYDLARNDESFLGRVLAGGLKRINRGYDEAIEGMQEVGEDENMALEHRLSYLALIGSIAPMVGLMGTVYGMIMSFQTIANSPVQPKPADLAGGISTALFTTLEGLTVAIPAMIFYSLLRNRVSRFVLEVGMISEGLMSRVFAAGKTPSGRPAAPAPSTPPATAE